MLIENPIDQTWPLISQKYASFLYLDPELVHKRAKSIVERDAGFELSHFRDPIGIRRRWAVRQEEDRLIFQATLALPHIQSIVEHYRQSPYCTFESFSALPTLASPRVDLTFFAPTTLPICE